MLPLVGELEELVSSVSSAIAEAHPDPGHLLEEGIGVSGVSVLGDPDNLQGGGG